MDKLKESDGSNKSLLGDGSEATERRVKGVPMRVAASMPDDGPLVVDLRAVLSAYGLLEVAVSEHAAFTRDALVTRITWRIGATISHPERVVSLSVPGATPTKAAAKKAPAGS